MLVLDAGLPPAGATKTPMDGRADLILVRTSAVHDGDVRSALAPEEIADGTTVLASDARPLRCWGLPASTPIGLDLDEPFRLRLDLRASPFAYRSMSIDLTVQDGRLDTSVASGSPDLTVRADWTAAVGWLTQPGILFADAFPSSVKIDGEIALLSLFEGAIWRATAELDPMVARSLLQWSQLWPAGPTRRTLRAQLNDAPRMARPSR